MDDWMRMNLVFIGVRSVLVEVAIAGYVQASFVYRASITSGLGWANWAWFGPIRHSRSPPPLTAANGVRVHRPPPWPAVGTRDGAPREGARQDPWAPERCE